MNARYCQHYIIIIKKNEVSNRQYNGSFPHHEAFGPDGVLSTIPLEHFAISVQYHMDRLYCMIVPIFFFRFCFLVEDDNSRGPSRLSWVSPQSFEGVVRCGGWTDVVPRAYKQLCAEPIDRILIEFRSQVDKLTYVYQLSVRAVDKKIRNKKSRNASITHAVVCVICQKYCTKQKNIKQCLVNLTQFFVLTIEKQYELMVQSAVIWHRSRLLISASVMWPVD